MTHIVIEQCAGYQAIHMNWTKQVPGFQPETFEIVRLALLAADTNDDISATVFFGAPSCFCLGTDVSTFGSASDLSDLSTRVRGFFRQLIRTRTPLIAAVNGDAVGLGMTMLLHFDAVFATPSSTFRAPFAEWGLVPEAASSVLLPIALGYQRAFDLFCLGSALDSNEALRAGLITRIHCEAELEEAARSAATRLSKIPRKALRATREMMRPDRHRLERRAQLETETFHELLGEASTQRRLKVMARASRLAINA